MTPDTTGCPLCGETQIHSFEASAHDSNVAGKKVALRDCLACEFAWQWPLDRTPEQSKEFFREEYQAKRKGSYFDKERRSAIASCQLEFLSELELQAATLLDIGCGDGAFARASARKGWKVTGLDPALPNDVEALDSPGIMTLVKGTPTDLDADKKFTCVTLWDVIEHLPDPEPVLRSAWDLVAPGGWLVLETGNYQSAERLLAGSTWWAWQLDHRWYFSPSTLLALLKPLHYAELRVAKRVLRPWSRGSSSFSAPPQWQTVLSVLKRPWRMTAIVAEHAAKREAATRWPDWAGLEIFALAVRK